MHHLPETTCFSEHQGLGDPRERAGALGKKYWGVGAVRHGPSPPPHPPGTGSGRHLVGLALSTEMGVAPPASRRGFSS